MAARDKDAILPDSHLKVKKYLDLNGLPGILIERRCEPFPAGFPNMWIFLTHDSRWVHRNELGVYYEVIPSVAAAILMKAGPAEPGGSTRLPPPLIAALCPELTESAIRERERISGVRLIDAHQPPIVLGVPVEPLGLHYPIFRCLWDAGLHGIGWVDLHAATCRGGSRNTVEAYRKHELWGQVIDPPGDARRIHGCRLIHPDRKLAMST